MSAYCTACGAPRVPLANASVTHAGQPSKVGGTVARVAGWAVLAVGWVVAALLAGLILLLGGGSAAAIVGGTIAVVTALVAYGLLRGGKVLQQSGQDAELAMKNQAVFALATARGGVLKAWDVAQSLHMTPPDADAFLTRLAKQQPDHVTVDIDEEGTLLYRFPSIHWGGAAGTAPPHVRVQSPGGVRVEPRDPLEEQFEALDAEARKARSGVR